jgi:hypothetical protein
MHLPQGFVLCCLFSFGTLGLAGVTPPAFGPNVKIFDPSMPINQIKDDVDAISRQQVSNEFGAQRYALLFMPGIYGSKDNPLNFEVGYYTAVAGLGSSPDDVVINGSIDVYNQCKTKSNGKTDCKGLRTFWRSLSNLKINVTNRKACNNREYWAVSQAAPMRRVHINGPITLTDDCSGPGYVSGGFIADSQFDGSAVISGQQQQWLIRNSKIVGWSNGVWNQLFSGVVGAPAQNFATGGPYTTLPTSPVTREAPYLYVDADGNYRVFVPSLQRDSAGTTWGGGSTPGSSISIDNFFVVKPADTPDGEIRLVVEINSALAQGKNLLFTPGIYKLYGTIEVTRPDTVVLGLGLPTLVPQDGVIAMEVADVPGVKLSGLLFDAGLVNSPVLLLLGRFSPQAQSAPQNPTSLSDVFFRIGGATPGKASAGLTVNSENVILDDIWAWRADHGNGVGWEANTADTGVFVNNKDVTAYGLFVEHFQEYEVIWNGKGGTVIFFQNEMPYDPPNQAAWMEAPDVKGWAAFRLVGTDFKGYGMGSYSIFETTIDKPNNAIYAANAFEVPDDLPAASLNDLLTVCLSGKVHGGIKHVINGIGGSSTEANPGQPVHVVGYP